APHDVHPKGDHGPAHDHEADVIFRSADGAIDQHVAGGGHEGQEGLEEDPGVLALLADDTRIGAGHDGAQKVVPAVVARCTSDAGRGAESGHVVVSTSAMLWPTRSTNTSS